LQVNSRYHAKFPLISDEQILAIFIYEKRGEGGIRTLGSLLSYGALAKRCFQPLSHLTNAEREYRGELPIANIGI
jgi:hypothetical protein